MERLINIYGENRKISFRNLMEKIKKLKDFRDMGTELKITSRFM
jgi:hypothetical protein